MAFLCDVTNNNTLLVFLDLFRLASSSWYFHFYVTTKGCFQKYIENGRNTAVFEGIENCFQDENFQEIA